MLRREFLLGTTALTMVASPAQAALIVVTGPNLNEIQDKLDAGEFPHYPGVVREGQWGRVGPSSGFVMADHLKPGTALPAIKEGSSLYRAAQSKKVTVAPFKRGRNATLLRLSKDDLTDFVLNQAERQEFVMVPEFFNELAYQNGIEPHEIATHVHHYREDQQTDLDTYLANQTEIIKAIAIGENLIVLDQEIIDAKLKEIETLKAAAEDGLQSEALQYLIDHLELEIENLTGETLLAALSESIIGERIADIANANIEEIHAYLRDPNNAPIPVGNHLWELSLKRAEEAWSLLPEVETIDRKPIPPLAELLRDHSGHWDSGWGVFFRDNPDYNFGTVHDYLANILYADMYDIDAPVTFGILTDEQKRVVQAVTLQVVTFYTEVTGILSAVYDQGYAEGYADGYADGYEQGYNDGYRAGYADGFRDGANSVRETLEGDDVQQET